MIAIIEFNSNIQDNDRIELKVNSLNELEKKFISWCKSRHLDPWNVNPRIIEIKEK